MKQLVLFSFFIFILTGLDGKAQTALEFDGVDDYVQTTFTGVLGTTSRTFQAWIYLSEAPGSNICITDYGLNAVGSRNTFLVTGSGYLGYISGGTNANITASAETVPIDSWVHVAFVFDGTNGYLYQDGVQVGTGLLTTVNTPSGNTNFRIGERVPGGSIPFPGMIDEVSVWEVALTQEEIIDYACITDPSIYPDLLVYYDFNEGTGTTLTDLVGDYDGTLMNMDEEDWVSSEVCSWGNNITFMVTEDDGTTPIENAEVNLDGEVKYTDLNGEAIFYYYDPDIYDYTVSKTGYYDQTGSVEVIDEDVTVEVSLPLIIYYDITFIVTEDPGGDPVEEALVNFDGAIQSTNEEGEITFTGYLPGTYSYTVTKEGYDLVTGDAEVIDENVTVDVALPISDPVYAVSFLVLEQPAGVAVEDALIDLDGVQQYTNEFGLTTFYDNLPGSYPYSVSKDGFVLVSGTAEVIDDNLMIEINFLIDNIQQNEITGINVYPNPTDGILNIRLAEEIPYHVTISDISGRILDNFMMYDKISQIDVSSIQKGLYLLTFEQGDKTHQTTLIIQ